MQVVELLEQPEPVVAVAVASLEQRWFALEPVVTLLEPWAL